MVVGFVTNDCRSATSLLLIDTKQCQDVRTYLVDVWQDTTTGDGSSNQLVQFLVTSDGQLQMSGSDTLDSQVFCGVTYSKLV